MRGRQTLCIGLTVLVVAAIAVACDEVRQLEFGLPAGKDQTFTEFIPAYDMVDSPATKAQEKGMMKPAPLTVSTTARAYPEAIIEDPEKAGAIKNPLVMTRANLEHGRELYNVYCVPCHGEIGLGNGHVVPKFPRPPSLLSKKMRRYPDGRVYHIISQGQNIMPHYRSQLRPMERWAIVNYIRVLQRAEYPKQADVDRYNQMAKAAK